MSLHDEGGPVTGQVAQRRRLALIAVLGVARSPVSRDRLVALLWPELDADGARHRLSDSVYVARRALGETAIETVGDDVWLNEARVAIDVRAFERALDAGSLDDAIALYTGPFLDGFHRSQSGEFERWVDDERTRLAGRYAQALKTLATDAERRSDFTKAVDILRRLAAVDPLDARVTLRLMSALEQAGDGAGALRQARIHQSLRNAELGLGEDPKVRVAADELAARLEVTSHPDQVSVAAKPASAPLQVSESHVNPAPAERSRRRLTRIHIGIAAGLLVLVVGAWSVATRRAAADAARAQPMAPGVAVFPFSDRGARAQEVAGEAMAVLLATKLDGGVEWRSIDPNALLAQYRPSDSHPDPVEAARLAHRLGATYFVLGDVVRATGTVYLGAALYDARSGEPVSARVGVQGASNALFELVDSLATCLLVGRRDAPAPQLARLASLTTSSLPALKEYLGGEALLRAGQYIDAATHFERAAAIDTTFSLAYYRLAWAHGWSRTEDGRRPLHLAARYSSRLPERIRLTLHALVARSDGNATEAERLLRSVLARYPDDFDASFELGDLLFHENPPRGRSGAEAREALERAASLDPTRSAEALFHLIVIASLQRRTSAIDSLSTRFLQLHPAGELTIAVRPILALARHDTLQLLQIAQELGTKPVQQTLFTAAVTAAVTGDLAGTARLVSALDDPSRPPADRATILIALAHLAGARGDWTAADSLMNQAQRFDASQAIQARARLLSLPIGAPPTAAIRDARAAVERMSRLSQPRSVLLAGLLALRLDELSAAHAAEKVAATPPIDHDVRDLLVELRARRALKQHRHQEALAILENEQTPPSVLLRFLRGEVLEALGRKDEALRWYVASEQDYGGELFRDAIDRARKRLAPGS